LNPNTRRTLGRIAAAVAVLFGLVTLVAGGRVLLGADPGYRVFMPLLVFNTAMGLAYVAVGVLAWRRHRLAVPGAAAIVLANLAMLAFIGFVYQPDGPVARQSLGAMSFRTAVWVLLLLVFRWTSSGSGGASPPRS